MVRLEITQFKQLGKKDNEATVLLFRADFYTEGNLQGEIISQVGEIFLISRLVLLNLKCYFESKFQRIFSELRPQKSSKWKP